MQDITFLSDEEKIQKLVADVKHKFSVFSVSNTLFPKNEISDSELKSFFEKISDRTTKILNAPTGTFNKIVNNQSESFTYMVSTSQSSTLDDLAKIVIGYLKDAEVIGFYDLTYDPNSSRYNIRLYRFEDDLRLKAIKRENKIDDILKDNNIGYF
jgi:hypothetical protein